MSQLSTVGAVTHAAPRPVASPLAPVADKPFPDVVLGLIGAQLARPSALPAEAAPALPAGIPTDEVTVGPNGPTTVTAFRFWHRVLPFGGDA